ncbi:MAG: DUF4382 domain-containing protein [Pseudomonadota bacterium]
MSKQRAAWAAGEYANALKDSVVCALITLSILALAGCGGSGGTNAVDEPTASADEGQLLVGLTDAEGDFATYAVDVLSIALERANGTVVETLPNATRVDFSELTEVTEFVSIATIPSGAYTSATIRLDFANAEIIVQDDAGMLSEAMVVDDSGNSLGEYSVSLQLPQSERIVIAPGVPAAFSLDFDLEASNTIDATQAPPVVTVSPVLLAMPEREEEREHRVRGALDSVDTAAGSFTLNVRPFNRRSGEFGELPVLVGADTVYDIDGEGFTGSAGLDALAALDAGTPVVANGIVAERTLTADVVTAGSSVPWADDTVVKGVVTARLGNVLTVSGTLVSPDRAIASFGGDYAVLMDAATEFSAPGIESAELDLNSVSVGQRVVAFGDLADDLTLDATEGRVALKYSRFSGTINSAAPLSAELFLLNGRRPGQFMFDGTGMDMALDADPADYEVDTGNLALPTLEAGDIVRVLGLVTPFGSAPADFTAKTVIDVEARDRAGQLLVRWPLDEPSTTPFISTSPTAIAIDTSASREVLSVRGVPRFLTNPDDMLTLIAPEDGEGAYSVSVRGAREITLYRNFEDLVDALNRALADGLALQQINAGVRYTGAQDDLPAYRASFIFREQASSE